MLHIILNYICTYLSIYQYILYHILIYIYKECIHTHIYIIHTYCHRLSVCALPSQTHMLKPNLQCHDTWRWSLEEAIRS